MVKNEGNMLRPVADGKGEVEIEYHDQSAKRPVNVQQARSRSARSASSSM